MEVTQGDYQMPIHPAANLFPLMTESEFQQLVESIRDKGLIEAIVICEGAVLDGRNRLRACEEAGVEPHFVEWDGSGDSPTRYAVTKNLHRRHLTVSQQATIGVAMLPLLREESRRRQATAKRGFHGGKSLPAKLPEGIAGDSRALAAKAVGVGEKTIDAAVAVQKADPEAFERLRKGETRVHTEYRRINSSENDRKLLYGPNGKRYAVITNAHVKRFTYGMGSIRGSVSAIAGLNPTYIVFGTSREETARWMRQIQTIVAELRKFGRALEEAINESNQQDDRHEDDRGQGSADSPARAEGAGSGQAQAD